MLKFSPANSKIEALASVDSIAPYLEGGRKVYSLDLLSGYSCPFAKDCLAKAVVKDGKRSIKDGPATEFRCFSASQEVVYTNVFNSRQHNFNALRSLNKNEMVELIQSSLPRNLGVCRIHVAGDFFNQDYFDAWIEVARNNPGRLFYAYTKSVRYWVNRLYDTPENFVLTASEGGREDYLIGLFRLRYAKVVFSEQEATELGLEIDHTDEHAANPQTRYTSFALLIHGVMPKGSRASEAIKALKKSGTKFSYSR
jgi:hypothetical protein